MNLSVMMSFDCHSIGSQNRLPGKQSKSPRESCWSSFDHRHKKELQMFSWQIGWHSKRIFRQDRSCCHWCPKSFDLSYHWTRWLPSEYVGKGRLWKDSKERASSSWKESGVGQDRSIHLLSRLSSCRTFLQTSAFPGNYTGEMDVCVFFQELSHSNWKSFQRECCVSGEEDSNSNSEKRSRKTRDQAKVNKRLHCFLSKWSIKWPQRYRNGNIQERFMQLWWITECNDRQ